MTERIVVAGLDEACAAIVARIAVIRHGDADGPDRTAAAGPDARLLVAIAGPPAGGKSTLADAVVSALDDAVLVPMDGFHLDDALLRPAGLLARKGSPETFDVDGFVALLDRVCRDDGRAVHVPVFERERELARAAAATVAPTHRTVVIEGNYLLLDEPPWNALAMRFDLAIVLRVEEGVLRERLVRRWEAHGFDAAEALSRAERNDLPNGRRVLEHSVDAHLELTIADRRDRRMAACDNAGFPER